VRITVQTFSGILFRPEIGGMMNLKGLRFCMHGALLLSIVFLGAGTHAQDEQPMMIKSQSGVPLDSDMDWEMCRPDGIAVGGYDPVSYRQPDGPVPGNAEFSAEHAGATYLFASESSLQKFLQNPDRYVPAYTGFCAVTLALGRLTCPDYTNFQIEDDQLLLFEVTGFTNGRTLWNSDATEFRQRADDNFDRLIELR
jgi:YHS domain-containing protein